MAVVLVNRDTIAFSIAGCTCSKLTVRQALKYSQCSCVLTDQGTITGNKYTFHFQKASDADYSASDATAEQQPQTETGCSKNSSKRYVFLCLKLHFCSMSLF